MTKSFQPDGLEIDYILSKEFTDNPQIVKDEAVANISLQKKNSKTTLIFSDDFALKKEVISEVNLLGKLEYFYHFYSDVNKKFVKIEGLRKNQQAIESPEPNSEEEEEKLLEVIDIDNLIKEMEKNN